MVEPYQQLEREFAHWADYPPANVVVCSSGTAALHLALEALQLPPGSEVLCPDFTMIACPRAITLAGLTPVFVDCGDDLLMDMNLLDKAWTKCTEAVMVVHIYGRRCKLDDDFWHWAKGLDAAGETMVVEDLAEAHGVKPHPKTDAAAYSFYRNKIVAGEEGGAVAFRNPAHAILARQLRSLGFTDAHDFKHIPRGHNYRLANALAAPILKSLADIHANLEYRRFIEHWYDEACPPEWKMPARDAVWVYDVRVPGMTAEEQNRVVRALQVAGIAARHGFKPMSQQDEYRSCRVIGGEIAEQASREVIYLPATPGTVTANTPRRAFDLMRHTLEAGEVPVSIPA